jgi:protein gp37
LDIWGKESPRRFFDEKHWNEPRRWNDRVKKVGGASVKVFCGSMCDILEDRRDLDESRERLWKLVEETPHLIWMLLSKRPGNYSRMLPSWWIDHPRANVWLMTTVESKEYLWRLEKLMAVPATIHAVSWEPALGYVDFSLYMAEKCCSGFECGCQGLPVNPPPYLDWVIGGGESGTRFRPFDIEWARRVRDDCRRCYAKFFLKQLGGHPDKRMNPAEWPEDLRIQEFPRE